MFDGEDENNKKKRRNDEGGRGEGDGDPGDPNKPKGVDFKSSRILFIIIIIGVVLAIFAGRATIRTQEDVSWSEFIDKVGKGSFSTVRFEGREVYGVQTGGEIKNAKETRATAPYPMPDSEYKKLSEVAASKGTQIKHEQESMWTGLLIGFLPWLLILFVIYFFVFRQLRGPGGPGGVLSFGKSRATLITKEKIKKTFKDVAGIEEAKQEVEEIVGFLKNPKKFQRLGGRIPKGVLLIGGPGTGKTLLAKSIAGEAEVPFFSISGSDFVEMFVGVGASRVRDLFQQARENSPCIIFLDEIDAVGRRRGTGIGGGHDEREQTLNEILVQMDGMESDEKIIVMAATNRPDVLDPALLRPGRFDRHVYVDLPDVKGREEILRVHSRKVKLSPDVDLTVLAKSTAGCSGADLENIINEAALIAVMKDKDAIDLADLDEARDKVSWGREKKSRVMDEAERWVTAYHETGHAVVGYLLPECDKPTKVTIIPRGRALGLTISAPEKDIYSYGRKQLLGRIKMMYGGRIAEQMFTGDITTGAQNDIEQATKIAQRMVCEWGMSDKVGPVQYKAHDEDVFLGREMGNQATHSQSTAVQIDQEVRGIIDFCYKEAEKLLESKRAEIEIVAKALMEHETINGDELAALMKTGKLEKRVPAKTVEHRPLPKVQKNPMSSTPNTEDLGGQAPTPQPA
jgi:cell division protease FtsH